LKIVLGKIFVGDVMQ